MLELTDGFEERLGFNIADGTADFNDGDAGLIYLIAAMETGLDLVGDMRNDLHGPAAVIAVTFLGQDGFIDLAGGDVGLNIQTLIDETFIVAEIQIGLGAIIGDENFAVLSRRHRAGIDVQIRIELLHGDVIATGL
jgi:hypothetical protein